MRLAFQWCYIQSPCTGIVKQTAILHIIGTGVIGAGVFVSGAELTVGLLILGATFIIAGIVLARRGDSTSEVR